MRCRACLFGFLLALPALAQSWPANRVDSASVGLGYHTEGFLVSFMKTGPRLGVFGGMALAPHSSSSLPMDQEGYFEKERSSAEFDLGLAARLDSRWVIGLGYGYSRETYDWTRNVSSAQWPMSSPAASPTQIGSYDRDKNGLVAMVNVRIGNNWGVQVTGGRTGIGGSICMRF